MRLLDENIKLLTTMKQQVNEDIQQGGQGMEVEAMETQRRDTDTGVTTRAKKRQNAQTE